MKGIVTAVDELLARVRVCIPDLGDLESAWLPVVQRNAGPNQDYWLPDIDELVAVLFDEHAESGFVLGAVYDESHPPTVAARGRRYVRFSDGAEFSYDRNDHHLVVQLPEGGTMAVTAPGGLSVTGDVHVDGHVEATGDVSDGAGSLAEHRQRFETHQHTGDSGGTTSPPLP